MVLTPGSQRQHERGQLVLIAAILVAVAVLGAVVLLNTVHSSPNVKAQTDSQSISDAERTTAQVQTDLEALFAATNTTDGEQYPFVNVGSESGNESELRDITETYESQFVEILSTNRSALLDVTYDSTRREIGNFTAGELDSSFSEEVMVGARSIPSLSVTSEQRVEIRLHRSGLANKTIVLDGVDTEYGETTGTRSDCTAVAAEELTLEFSRGSGTIRDESRGVCVVDLYEPETVTDVTVEIVSSGSGSFALTGVGPDSSSGETVIRDVIVNAVFEMTYNDPNVEYSSEFVLYGGDSQ